MMTEFYEEKFREFIKLCAETKAGDYIVINHPEVLGDNYEEIIESLNRLADAEIRLTIVPRRSRTNG